MKLKPNCHNLRYHIRDNTKKDRSLLAAVSIICCYFGTLLLARCQFLCCDVAQVILDKLGQVKGVEDTVAHHISLCECLLLGSFVACVVSERIGSRAEKVLAELGDIRKLYCTVDINVAVEEVGCICACRLLSGSCGSCGS